MGKEINLTFKLAGEKVSINAVVEIANDDYTSITVTSREEALLISYYYTGSLTRIEQRPNVNAWGVVVYTNRELYFGKK
jgi:hypothetical protein